MIEPKKDFTLVVGGYAVDEVDAYIASLLEQIDETEDKTEVISKKEVSPEIVDQFEVMKHELDEYKEIEQSLKDALTATHEATKRIQSVVEDEARKILYDANKNADVIIEEALNQSMHALKYIKQMRTDARVFQKRLKILVNEQDKLAENALWKEILAPIESYDLIEIDDIKEMIKNDK